MFIMEHQEPGEIMMDEIEIKSKVYLVVMFAMRRWKMEE
jgi:hypothetical protein